MGDESATDRRGGVDCAPSDLSPTRRAFLGLVVILSAGQATVGGTTATRAATESTSQVGFGHAGFGEGGYGGIPSEPSVDDYRDDDGVVQTDGLRAAISDWRVGHIDTQLLRDVIGAWRIG